MQLGRQIVPLRPRLQLGDVLTGTVPAHPDRVDYLMPLNGGWQVLGNDRAGDCEAVRWANSRRLVTATLTDTVDYPDQDMVWAVYKTQNPGFDPDGDPDVDGPGSSADQGMQTQLLLEHLHTDAGPDGVKVVAFAEVDYRNEAEVDAALAIFGELWLDVVVQDAQQQQFASGLSWEYDPTSPTDGGHAVLAGGYTPSDDECADIITWGQEVKLGQSFFDSCVDSAWVVIWPEHLGTKAFLEGIDQSKLADAYKALTGRDFPAESVA